jgi:hypothetical protein
MLRQSELTGVVPPNKDDLNIIMNVDQQGKPAFVDMQINMEPTARLKYCDNTAGPACDARRVVSAKISYDGKAWGHDLGLRTPDAQDPPELQFYRFRPFMIGDSGRLAGHALQYAPSPWLGDDYGRQPTHCVATTNQSCWTSECGHCHGPHMYEELWLGPSSGAAWNVSGWRRPFRLHHFVRHDAFLMANPVTIGSEHLWLSAGEVWSLPKYRVAGLYAPANGELSTAPFTWPAGGVAVNAALRWRGRTVTGGCDEGCAGYLFFELLDADSRMPIPGYERSNSKVLTDVDDQGLPVEWGRMISPPALAHGQVVVLRLFFRDATVYSVDAQSSVTGTPHNQPKLKTDDVSAPARQLFFDLTSGVESSAGVAIAMHAVDFGDRLGQPAGALVPEAAFPWEGGRFNYYHSVLDNGSASRIQCPTQPVISP